MTFYFLFETSNGCSQFLFRGKKYSMMFYCHIYIIFYLPHCDSDCAFEPTTEYFINLYYHQVIKCFPSRYSNYGRGSNIKWYSEKTVTVFFPIKHYCIVVIFYYFVSFCVYMVFMMVPVACVWYLVKNVFSIHTLSCCWCCSCVNTSPNVYDKKCMTVPVYNYTQWYRMLPTL